MTCNANISIVIRRVNISYTNVINWFWCLLTVCLLNFLVIFFIRNYYFFLTVCCCTIFPYTFITLSFIIKVFNFIWLNIILIDVKFRIYVIIGYSNPVEFFFIVLYVLFNLVFLLIDFIIKICILGKWIIIRNICFWVFISIVPRQ
jgi:hypothetical protein